MQQQVYTPPPRPVEHYHHAPKVPFVDNYELPKNYGTTDLRLLVKDPFWLHAYWEVAPHSLESAKSRFSRKEADASRMVLRMYDVTLVDFNGSNANHYFDLEVGPNANNWYVSLWQDGVSYVGELGLRSPDGKFCAVTRSNPVDTPRMGYSPRSEEMWMKVFPDMPYTHPYVVSKVKVPGLDKGLDKKTAAKIDSLRRKRRVIHLSDEDIRRYYSKLSPSLKDIIADRLTKSLTRQVKKEHIYSKKELLARLGEYAFLLEGGSEANRARILSWLPKEYLVRRVILGSSLDIVLLGASEQLVKGPGGASDFVGEKMKHRKFFFELDAELIVYGRTEPDAEVYLGDKKIHLRQDGTFTLRFALPDGKIPLGFTAISNDKEEIRKISTTVERNTRYGE